VDAILAHLPSVPATAVRRLRRPITIPDSTVIGPHPDGLGLVRRALEEAPDLLRPGGRLVLSMQGWQWSSLEERARQLGYVVDDVATEEETGAVVRLRWEGLV
jgi:methylase of polypeptide subunit release factors